MKNESKNPLFGKLIFFATLMVVGLFFAQCKSDDDDKVPAAENEEEEITKLELKWTPIESVSGAHSKTITTGLIEASGKNNTFPTDKSIALPKGKKYKLEIVLGNDEGDDATSKEVKKEGADHQFFFSWTNDIFSDPAGDGNIDNRGDDVNYLDKDENDRPLGLETEWTTAGDVKEGEFTIKLKHQPGEKSDTSDSGTGSTDVNFTIKIKLTEPTTDVIAEEKK